MNDLLKQAKAGRPVKDEDIPPPVSTAKPAPSAPPPEPDPAPVEPEPAAPPPEEEEDPPSLPEPTEPPPPPPVESEAAALDPEKQQGLQMILSKCLVKCTIMVQIVPQGCDIATGIIE